MNNERSKFPRRIDSQAESEGPHVLRKLLAQTTQPTYTARPINKPGTPEKFISIAFRGRSQFPPPDRNLFSPRDRAKFGRAARRVPAKGSLRRVS